MKKRYLKYFLPFTGGLFLMLCLVSCKKDHESVTPPVPDPVNFAKLGLYEQISGSDRRLFIGIFKVGTVPLNYASVFDTGSTGMTIDASGLLPASMITSSGIQVAGDSVNVNGITVTTQQAIISYGGVDGEVQVYGNLAYAPVTIGDANSNVSTPRIPIFLYYKVMDVTNNKQLAAHSVDVFGVGPGVSYTSRLIGSPLSYFKLGTNVTNGFRLAMLSSAGFTNSLTDVAALLYIGLTPDDLNSSGFIMHQLSYSSIGGYSPDIPSTISYNGTNVPGTILFDTGTPAVTIIANGAAKSNVATLPANTSVSITTNQGFNYQYTTATNHNVTEVENTNYSNDIRTIFSIDFFVNNEYLLDYANHRIGLKNN